MKKFLMALLIAFPLAANADLIILDPDGSFGHDQGDTHMAENIARELAQSLRRLSDLSLDVAERAAHNGNIQRSRKFADLSYQAQELGQDVRRDIVVPLRRGEPARRVARDLERLQYHFENLGDALRVIAVVPLSIEREAQEVRHANQMLQRMLRVR